MNDISSLRVLSSDRTPPNTIIIKNYDRTDTLWVGYWIDKNGTRKVYAGVDADETAFSIRRQQLGVI